MHNRILEEEKERPKKSKNSSSIFSLFPQNIQTHKTLTTITTTTTHNKKPTNTLDGAATLFWQHSKKSTVSKIYIKRHKVLSRHKKVEKRSLSPRIG